MQDVEGVREKLRGLSVVCRGAVPLQGTTDWDDSYYDARDVILVLFRQLIVYNRSTTGAITVFDASRCHVAALNLNVACHYIKRWKRCKLDKAHWLMVILLCLTLLRQIREVATDVLGVITLLANAVYARSLITTQQTCDQNPYTFSLEYWASRAWLCLSCILMSTKWCCANRIILCILNKELQYM